MNRWQAIVEIVKLVPSHQRRSVVFAALLVPGLPSLIGTAIWLLR